MKRLRPERLPRRCDCGKLKCQSIEHARQVHARIWAEKGGTPAARFYECEHHAWHWTRWLNPTPEQLQELDTAA
jgi:hypothetical protein